MKHLITLILSLALVSQAYAKGAKTPYISKDSPGPDSCYAGDTYGPCKGRIIKVRNPHKTRTYYVRLGCGEPSLATIAFIPPRSTAIFDLRWGGPGSLLRGQCRIKNVVWYPALNTKRKSRKTL